jgi:dihydrodipicolinate synthase/N-acetylneuraminate lyase
MNALAIVTALGENTNLSLEEKKKLIERILNDKK